MAKFISPIEAVDKAKACLGLKKPNEELTFDEVKEIVKVVMANCGDSKMIGDTAILGPMSVQIGMLVTRIMFPQYCKQLDL